MSRKTFEISEENKMKIRIVAGIVKKAERDSLNEVLDSVDITKLMQEIKRKYYPQASIQDKIREATGSEMSGIEAQRQYMR